MQAFLSSRATLEYVHQVSVCQRAKTWGLELQMFDAEVPKRGREDAIRAVAAAVIEDPFTLESRLEAIRIVQDDAPRLWSAFCEGRVNPEHVMAMADALVSTDATTRGRLAATAWKRARVQNIDEFTTRLRREVPGILFERLIVSGLP